MDMETIYRLYFRDVYLFLQGLTRSETLAEELTQETFFKALDGLKNFDGKQDVQERALQAQLDKLRGMAQDDPLSLPWVKELLASGRLTELDRPTVAAAIREIRVYEGNRVEIDYLLPEGYRALLEGR